MVPYLSRLERAAHNRFVVGSSPTGTTKGKTLSFPSFIFIPPIYDHSQIRITHDLIHHVLQCNSVESGAKKALTL